MDAIKMEKLSLDRPHIQLIREQGEHVAALKNNQLFPDEYMWRVARLIGIDETISRIKGEN